MTDDTRQSADGSFPPGRDLDALMLAEVARLLPDATVVTVPAPRSSGRPVPADVDAVLGAAQRGVAAMTAWIWRDVLAVDTVPRARQFWMTDRFTDAVTNETRSQTSGNALVVMSGLAASLARLEAAGWRWERRTFSDDHVRVTARAGAYLTQIELSTKADTVSVRMSSASIVTGPDRADELDAATPIEVTL